MTIAGGGAERYIVKFCYLARLNHSLFLMRKILLLALLATGTAHAQTDPARRDIGNLTVENIPALPADLLARV